MTADPVSWLLIEPGWRVVDADGGEIGKVEAITGDSDADIFDGLAVATTVLARPTYVPAEHVGVITEGTVHLTLERSAFDALGERLEPGLAHESPREHGETLVRRFASWFARAGRR